VRAPTLIGAHVLVDEQHEAVVVGYFPDGSCSYMFPHYRVTFVGGDPNVAVSLKRVSVRRRRR
jgi:hypothetical protein